MPLRSKAFLIHLCFSTVVGLHALALVFKLWYPAPLHEALGVTQIFLILLCVDVILGPCLTLIVYREGKKSLLLDISMILAFQVAAFIYGIWTVFAARPVWIVFNVDRFDVVQAVDIDRRKISEALAEFQKNSLFGPRWVGAVRPENAQERQDIMFEAVTYGSDIAQRPNLYRPLTQFNRQIADKAESLEGLYKFNTQKSVENALATWPQAKYWLPLKARSKPMVVLLAEDASVLAIVDLIPWD